MSLTRCDYCETIIDTDAEPEAYDGPDPFKAMCDGCREEHLIEE